MVSGPWKQSDQKQAKQLTSLTIKQKALGNHVGHSSTVDITLTVKDGTVVWLGAGQHTDSKDPHAGYMHGISKRLA